MYDVVIVGASVSGCAAATFYGRNGLRVALLEKHRSIETPKGLCGHFILGGAEEVMSRLGATERLVDDGAATGQIDLHGDAGPFCERSGSVPPLVNARRSLLDPTLRRIAAETPGVDLLLGHGVTELIEDGPRIVGVRTGGREFRAPLVVAADGHRSKVATLAGVGDKRFPNERAFLYGYYRDVGGVLRDRATVWAVDGIWSVASPTDDGLTELVVMPPKRALPADADELAPYLEDHISSLPSGPDLTAARREGKLVVSRDYPLVRRHLTPRPGLALIGDAALTSDPTPATGCTWAMWSAEWLADATSEALRVGRGLDGALARYRRAHRRIERDFRLLARDARTGESSPIQRLVWGAATRDPHIAWKATLVGMQVTPLIGLLVPSVLGRALVVALRRTATARAEKETVPAV
jgi:flavin-dependent dehydrogenase